MSTLIRKWGGVALTAATLLLVALLLATCGGQPAAPAPVEPTAIAQAPAAPPADTAVPPTQAPPADTAVPPTQAPEPSPTLAPTDTPAPAPTATEAAAAASVDSTNCVTCHTSEETLQKLAKEEAPAEKLSEGEG